ADAPAFRQMTGRAPEKIMIEFLGTRLFETENFAALWIDSGHDVPDGTVLAGSIHPLKNQEQCMAVGRVVNTLQRTQLLDVFVQELFIPFLGLANGLHHRRPFLEFDLLSGPHTEIL